MEIKTEEELLAIVMESIKKIALGDMAAEEINKIAQQREYLDKYWQLIINHCSNVIAASINTAEPAIEEKNEIITLMNSLLEVFVRAIKKYVKDHLEKVATDSSNIN